MKKTLFDYFGKSPTSTPSASREAQKSSTPVTPRESDKASKKEKGFAKTPSCSRAEQESKLSMKTPSRKSSTYLEKSVGSNGNRDDSSKGTLTPRETTKVSAGKPISKTLENPSPSVVQRVKGFERRTTPTIKVSVKKSAICFGDSLDYDKSECDPVKKIKVSDGSEHKKTLSTGSKSTIEKDKKTTPSKAKVEKKRKVTITSDTDDSEDEYKPNQESESESDSVSEDTDSDCPPKKKKSKKEPVETPKVDLSKYAKKKPEKATPSGHSASFSTFSSSSSSKGSSGKLPNVSHEDVSEDKFKYLHEKLDWLKPENIKDKFGKKKSHPEYNPETLYVPESFKKTLTPGLKQWWDLKSDHFDTVLFFKVGKFYEFYHMDAVIGVKELDLSYMKGDFAHAGFPETAFGKFSDILIQKGYKVARIEQTENPQMMEQRCKSMKNCTKYDRVVKRELCQVTSKGTRTLSYDEWCSNIGSQDNFLLSICEKQTIPGSSLSEYGICVVDTTIGMFKMGQFADDRHQSRLLSFIALYPAVEIIFEKSSVSQKTLKLIESNLVGVIKQALPSSSFWDASKTLRFMAESKYYNGDDGNIKWPDAILEMLDQDDRLFQTPLKEYELAFKALGACIWYLKKCYIEDCLLTMKLFEIYKPVDGDPRVRRRNNQNCKTMILDNVTLFNLAIVPTQPSVKPEETLFGTLNYCETNFGKRELRKWLCSPLLQPSEICDRLDAIDDLKNLSIFEDVRKQLKKLPDLERLLNKIHVHGLARSKDHPDSRAILYEQETYNKKKISDLLSAIEGFKVASFIASLFDPYVEDFKSNLLKNCVSRPEEGDFPIMAYSLSYFVSAFDHEEAMQKGSIIPRDGVDGNYDNACKEIENTLAELESYRKSQCEQLSCNVRFVHAGKNRYLLELPENKFFPSDYEFQGGRKGFKRFYTRELKVLLSTLTSAEETRNSALRDSTRCIFEQFDKHYSVWSKAVRCLATLDVLLSLANYCKTASEQLCRPRFRNYSGYTEPYLEIIEGRHPTFARLYDDKDYIPNSLYIGKKDDSRTTNKGGVVILVTGPNMGGKSTLMRQTGTLLVMAHVGCYVPAESMDLSPVDRIFTRVGANDHIFKGESTFFVESSETASILQHATRDSFVLIDELGRGTATFDGTAIAYATADHLANNISCRTLFSTHYHTLVDDFKNHSNVGLGHMACIVEEDVNCPTLEKVTFLYKFVDGACPKSYGFNVALLAGVKKEIVHKALLKSQQIDNAARISKLLSKLLHRKDPENIAEAFKKLII